MDLLQELEGVPVGDRHSPKPGLPGSDRLNGTGQPVATGTRTRVVVVGHRVGAVGPADPHPTHPGDEKEIDRSIESRGERQLDPFSGFTVELLTAEHPPKSAVQSCPLDRIGNDPGQVGEILMEIVDGFSAARGLLQQHTHATAEGLEVSLVRAELGEDFRSKSSLTSEPGQNLIAHDGRPYKRNDRSRRRIVERSFPEGLEPGWGSLPIDLSFAHRHTAAFSLPCECSRPVNAGRFAGREVVSAASRPPSFVGVISGEIREGNRGACASGVNVTESSIRRRQLGLLPK